jgi:hypothetical protein
MKLNFFAYYFLLFVFVESTIGGTLVIHDPYTRFTVSDGELATACLRLLGSRSVEDFQKRNGLEVDGVVGQLTWSRLSRALMERQIRVLRQSDSRKLIRLNLELQADELRLDITNLTDQQIAVHSFESNSIIVPVAVKYSGSNGGRQYHGSAPFQFHGTASTLPPGKSMYLKTTVSRIGSGATELRVSIPVVLEDRTVFMLSAPPLSLDGNLRFGN